MKKILVLSASPRKQGNSDRLSDSFITGAKEVGHFVEKIYVCDQNIKYCTGCGVCQTTHACVQKDDMAPILQKMVDADCIVFATPVYFYNMNAQLKTLLDRTTPQYLDIRKKDFYILMSAAEDDIMMMKHVVDSFQAYFDCLEDATLKGVIYGLKVYEVNDIVGNVALEEAYALGKAIV